MPDPEIEAPELSPLAWFQQGMARGGIAMHPDNGVRPFPPRLKAGAAFAPIEAARLVRTGTLYSATRVAAKDHTYVLALVDLDGGGRLLARMRGEMEPAAMIGRRVELADDRTDAEPFLTFRLISGEQRP